MKVLILSGSVGEKSCTRTMLKYLDQLLSARGVETVWWDMGDNPLPIAIPEYHNQTARNPSSAVKQFNQAIEGVDGFILGSPLYHGSYSGVLKNALDNLPPQAFHHKPVGMVSHSSNARSCVIPCDNLRPIVRSLGGYSTQGQIGTTDEDYVEKDGKLVLMNPKIMERADDLIEELIRLSKLLKRGVLPFS